MSAKSGVFEVLLMLSTICGVGVGNLVRIEYVQAARLAICYHIVDYDLVKHGGS